jgi:GNAT superfamily N-acetyltransferase
MQPRDLAARLPDAAHCIDLRGLLLSGRCRVFPEWPAEGEGFVARSIDFPYAAVAGTPSREAILAAVDGADAAATAWAGEESVGEWHLLVPPETADAVQAMLPPAWQRREVVLHSLAGDVPAAGEAPPGTDVRLAPDGHAAAGFDLSHLPPALGREYAGEHVGCRPLAAAFVDGRAAAFCYAPISTETLWDVAVDTLEPYRRRGLAAACYRLLAAHLAEEQGLAPVWGALAENRASIRLAAKLGFTPAAELTSIVLKTAG